MKILIISDAWHPQVNGVVRTYEHLSTELEKQGHTVKVIGPADFPLRVPMLGYPEIKLAVLPYRRLKKMIEEFQPDSIHVSAEGPLGWAARRYCVKHNHAYTTSYHTHFPDYVAKRAAKFLPYLYNFFHGIAKKIILKFHAPSTTMMVATQSLEDELSRWKMKPRMHRLSRGANLQQFSPGEKKLFNDLKRPVAIYVGRIAIEKNLEEFLKMPWDGSKVMVGDGPSLPALKKKFPDAVFVGKKEGMELGEHYRSADLFVFPSRTDTFGIVLIEALAAGLPIAAYNVTGPKDIITEPFLGAVHDDDLAIAAQEALKHGTPEQRSNHVKAYYTWENAGQQFVSALVTKDGSLLVGNESQKAA